MKNWKPIALTITILAFGGWIILSPKAQLAEDNSLDFAHSESCMAEISAGYSKMIDFVKTYDFPPPDGMFDPRCQKQEMEAFGLSLCVKRYGDIEFCRNSAKTVACLDKWDDTCPAAVRAFRASAPAHP